MRAFGADDENPPRTPAAWMISLAPLFTDGSFIWFSFPVPFSMWVTSSERYWVILAKRRT
jgi:hypothetical protein